MQRGDFRELGRYRTVRQARDEVARALRERISEELGALEVLEATEWETEFTVRHARGWPVSVMTTAEVWPSCDQEVEGFEGGKEALSFTVTIGLPDEEGEATAQETYALRTLNACDNPFDGIEWAVERMGQFLDMEVILCPGCKCEVAGGGHCDSCAAAIREDHEDG